MKQYGKMFRYVERADQPEPKTRQGKKLCPLCRCWKNDKDFIGADKLPRRYCRTCRANFARERNK